jgi:hypothetical protein
LFNNFHFFFCALFFGERQCLLTSGVFDLQRKVEAFGVAHISQDTYLPRNPEMQTKRYRNQDYDYTASG